MSNNHKIKEVDFSKNMLTLMGCFDNQKTKDSISTFMLSNKTLQHIILTDCAIDRCTAEFLIGVLLLRPNVLAIHSD